WRGGGDGAGGARIRPSAACLYAGAARLDSRPRLHRRTAGRLGLNACVFEHDLIRNRFPLFGIMLYGLRFSAPQSTSRLLARAAGLADLAPSLRMPPHGSAACASGMVRSLAR